MTSTVICAVLLNVFAAHQLKINGEAATWCFKMNGKNQKAPIASQIEPLTVQSVKECGIKCGRKFPDCQSVSYNDQTNECILQRTFSYDPAAPPIDSPDFEFLDMKDPVDICVSENPCKNNATCSDYFGFDYTCNCTSEIYASVNCTKLGKVLLIGSHPSVRSIEIYNTQELANSKILSTSLAQGLYSHVSGVFDNGVVAIVGGKKASGFSLDTQLYDTYQDQIITGPLPSEERYLSAATVINDEMFVCGGSKPGFIDQKTCEKLFFNQTTNQYQWEQISPMNSMRHAPAMAGLNGNLFVIGGYSGGHLNVVERYDISTNTWSYASPMPSARNRLAAAVLNGEIYACGGVDGTTTLATSTCGRYNPMTDTWTSTASMTTSRIGLSLLSIDGKLYAFGGIEVNGSGTPMDSVEEYDPSTNSWTTVGSMKIPRAYQTSVFLK